ncbi:ROK family transcriptional regulator [Sanguibacter sp. 25GB23B1]|uniref:ROK family transcriptional regulator n=1 Tax=unclassified Sanguibacter TaxID=2645534 RepID=UPI0032B00CE2
MTLETRLSAPRTGDHRAWEPLTGAARRIALEVLLDGPLSRRDLSRRMALSPGSLTRLTRPLLDSGLLVEAGSVEVGAPETAADATDGAGTSPRLGRPAQPLAVVPGSHHFIGVKLTGDHAYAALTDLRAEILAADDAPLPGHEPQDVLDVVAALTDRLVSRLAALSAGAGVTGLGVSVGGHVDGRSVVTDAPHLGWLDVPLGELLTTRTGLRTVVENDIVAVTEATHWFGEGHGCDRFALFTIGAGIGYGLVVHGEAVTSPEAGLSLLSHFPLDATGPTGPCGHAGCATAMLTIGALVTEGSSALGREVTYDQLLDLAAAGDPVASGVVDRAGRALGRMLAAVANLTMPERIVLGGEGVRLAQVAAAAVRDGLHHDRNPRTRDPEISLQSPELALWARGAAVVAIQSLVLGR